MSKKNNMHRKFQLLIHWSQHHDDIQGTLLLMGQVQLIWFNVFPNSYFIRFDGLMWCDVQVQEKLRLDLRRKIEALDIDQTCFSLDNRSLLCPIYFTIGCSGSVANMFVANVSYNCTLDRSSYDLLCTMIKIRCKDVTNVFSQLSRNPAAPRSSPGRPLFQRPAGKIFRCQS